MTISVTSPVTGGAQTGLTSPTYTIVTDTAPTAQGKQYAVTALGGTQTGVTVSSVAAPFTLTFVKPAVLKGLQPVDPVTGVLRSVPRNTYHVIVRKGVLPLAGQAYTNMICRASLEVPAGSDLADPANVRAALSLLIGGLNQISAGLGDTVVSGVM